MTNNGHTWQVDLPAEGSSLKGGAIPGVFKVDFHKTSEQNFWSQAWQMHAHWGSRHGQGSEHALDGKKFDAELHIVHFNPKVSQLREAITISEQTLEAGVKK